eukprot:366314-Chlamydomonas_euryale.AAC.1
MCGREVWGGKRGRGRKICGREVWGREARARAREVWERGVGKGSVGARVSCVGQMCGEGSRVHRSQVCGHVAGAEQGREQTGRLIVGCELMEYGLPAPQTQALLRVFVSGAKAAHLLSDMAEVWRFGMAQALTWLRQDPPASLETGSPPAPSQER